MALAVVAVLVTSTPVAAHASNSEPTWFRAHGHFAYCAHDASSEEDGPWIWCFSSVSGRWIRITGIQEGKYVRVGKGDSERYKWISRKRVSTGVEPKLIGFRRTSGVRDLGTYGLYYDSRPGDNSVVCSAVRAFFKCWVNGARFWFKPDGSFRVTRG